ncbi:MAG TPA: hypothetical protein VF220_08470 [Nitrososphaeraceae archaeon]
MNIVEMENSFVIQAKTIGHKQKNVIYSVENSYHNICIDKRGILLEQIQACERVLRYAGDRIDQIILEKEIADLKLMLDLIE